LRLPPNAVLATVGSQMRVRRLSRGSNDEVHRYFTGMAIGLMNALFVDPARPVP
jgi:hypothetical protein